MVKVAVIGANGQVGAELCLLLAARANIELVPVCRNRSGSAFLRWQGMPCRHGRAADPADAPRLLGDCDVVINSSLATGSPAEIRRIEDAIIGNMFACSKPSASIIHFSTQSVYGDPRRGRLIRWRNPYGRVKLATERSVRAAARRSGKPAYILRLGHVCGAMQGMSADIQEAILTRTVILPSEDCSSNTVYTAAIAEAIVQIVRGGAAPQTYDLMNHPPWEWRAVYEHEAKQCNGTFAPCVVPTRALSFKSRMAAAAMRLAAALATAQPMRDLAAKGFAHLPARMNAAALGWWYRKRARSEIGALSSRLQPPEHLSWVANGKRLFPAERRTLDVLNDEALNGAGASVLPRAPWPADLPDAGNLRG